MIEGFNLLTTNMGLIHIVISSDLNAESIKRIATDNNSDHDGISCLINFKNLTNENQLFQVSKKFKLWAK